MTRIIDLFAKAIGNYLESIGFENIENKMGGFYKYRKECIIVTVPLFKRSITCIFVQFGNPPQKIKENIFFDRTTSRLNFLTRTRNGIKAEQEFKIWLEDLLYDR